MAGIVLQATMVLSHCHHWVVTAAECCYDQIMRSMFFRGFHPLLWSSKYLKPSHHPLIVHRNGGGRPGRYYNVNDVNVYLDKQREGGVLHWRNEWKPFLVVSIEVLKFQMFCASGKLIADCLRRRIRVWNEREFLRIVPCLQMYTPNISVFHCMWCVLLGPFSSQKVRPRNKA